MLYMEIMSKEDIGKRIRHVREHELKMSQKELASVTGVPQTTLSKLERGKQDGSSDVALIAKHIGVCALWLSHGYGPKHEDKQLSDDKGDDEYVYQYEDSRCVFGPRQDSLAELPMMAFPAQVFERLGLSPDKCFGFHATDSAIGMAGDSMLISAEECDPRNASGKTYAIRQGSALLFRNVFVSAAGGFRLSCDNTDKAAYPDEHIAPADTQRIVIVGRVRYVGGAR